MNPRLSMTEHPKERETVSEQLFSSLPLARDLILPRQQSRRAHLNRFTPPSVIPKFLKLSYFPLVFAWRPYLLPNGVVRQHASDQNHEEHPHGGASRLTALVNQRLIGRVVEEGLPTPLPLGSRVGGRGPPRYRAAQAAYQWEWKDPLPQDASPQAQATRSPDLIVQPGQSSRYLQSR